MTLDEQFTKAQSDVKTLKARPSNDTMLELYSLYKQSTDGDVAGSRPGMFDLVGRAKFDAWAKRKGTAKDAAKTAYVALVEKLLKA
jgi:diazepam-binding inhibitor (GABA receptor modulating acyl-CoA-binding protein)